MTTLRLAAGDGSRATALLALSENPDFSAQLWGARKPPLNRARRILDNLASPSLPGVSGFFVIITSADAVAGVCRVDPLRDVARAAEVGYAIAPAFSGRGYASDALRLVVDHSYRNAPLQTLRGVCDRANLASQRVLEKAGFSLVPRARSRSNSALRLRYELTRSEWWISFEAPRVERRSTK